MTRSISISHQIDRDDLGLGVVIANFLDLNAPNPNLAHALDELVALRQTSPLSLDEEECRRASRDILRNGSYKPTGRGKPANEFLLKMVYEDFPRINSVVDINNLISLKYSVPISIFDIDRSQSTEFEVRLGIEEEAYIFNKTGQVLQLKDLVCGCRINKSISTPIVSPIKDSHETKITNSTSSVLGLIYYPLQCGGLKKLDRITAEFAQWLESSGPDAQAKYITLITGQSSELSL